MKKLSTAIAILLFLTCIPFSQGCSKDDDNNNNNSCPGATYPIQGLWEGTYSVNGMSQPPLYYSLTIYSDSTILTKGLLGNGSSGFSYGTWTLNGSAFEANIETMDGSGIEQRINATYSNNGTLSNATWLDTQNPYTSPLSGTFNNMNRIN